MGINRGHYFYEVCLNIFEKKMSLKYSFLFFGVFLFFLHAIAASDEETDSMVSCDGEWIPFPHHDYCFLFKNGSMTWQEGKEFFESIGGYLAENIDEELEEYIEFYAIQMFDPFEPYAWLGGSDVIQEGVWRWSNSTGNIVETFWAENEPKNDPEMNCLELEVTGNVGWYDWPCHIATNVICQKDAN